MDRRSARAKRQATSRASVEGLSPFAAALGLIAVLELGDKTQLTTISLASRHPWLPVLLGASSGLVLDTGIGVAIGILLSEVLAGSLNVVRVGGGVGFVAVGILTLLRPPPDRADARPRNRRPFLQAFAANAVAELGDKTQLAVIVLAATTSAPVSVFFGASLALVLIAGSSVLIGTALSRIVEAGTMRIIGALLFVVAGILLIGEAAVST